jgi:hypothetical protein
MFKNRFLLVLGVISILSVTMAVSYARPNASLPADLAGSDFYQRHPNWTWAVRDQNATIPVTGASAFPDYFQRHTELTVPSILGLDASDYFMRHPELTTPILGVEASDYFQRHPEMTIPSSEASVDLTDYFFRHPALRQSSTNIDLTDYYFRHS